MSVNKTPDAPTAFDPPDINWNEDPLCELPTESVDGQEFPPELPVAYEVEFMNKPGVEGVGMSVDDSGNPTIVVYVRSEAYGQSLPQVYDGLPVCIEVVGEIRIY